MKLQQEPVAAALQRGKSSWQPFVLVPCKSLAHIHMQTKTYRAIYSFYFAGGEVILVQMSCACIHPGYLAISSLSQLTGRHVIYFFTNVSPL